MEARRIALSALWVALILTHLWYVYVLPAFSSDAIIIPDWGYWVRVRWQVIGVFFLIPILMLWLTLVLPQPVDRWANIVVAIFFFLYNLVWVLSSPSPSDKFVGTMGLNFNVLTVWLAWHWV